MTSYSQSVAEPPNDIGSANAAPKHPWNLRSIGILLLAWFILQIGSLFTPGLLDDVDSIYIEIAREMLLRHDYVTPFINGVRFFDKPPLLYWMAAGSMHLFGAYDWAARLPLALSFLALIFAVYALGIRLFREVSPRQSPDRGGFYAALAIATSVGPYLFTRFYIPDILLALWMTVGIHLFFLALDRIRQDRSTVLPCLAFAAVMALNVLTKGLIGLVFPIGFVLLYLAVTKQLHLLKRLHLVLSSAIFLAIAAPWHILAALRNPAIPLPAGMGLPATGGWAWFYLYNEHIARFLGRRIPHDYGQVPIPLFWLLSAVWIMPWATFLPSAIADEIRSIRNRAATTARQYEASISLLLWTAIVIGFFTLSSRQEYYNLPALPALALMAAGLLARADTAFTSEAPSNNSARTSALVWSLYFLLPLTSLVAIVCGYFAITAPEASPQSDIASLLASNPEFYNLSLGHLFDLTGDAMGLFRGPLIAVALSMLAIGLGSYLIRRRNTYAANLTLAAGMTVTLLAAHTGLTRFYPILGSEDLAVAINLAQRIAPRPDDLILLDGELTSGSSLIFYTHQQIHLIHGKVNGLWYGSFWPDAPPIFESGDALRQMWSTHRRIFLLTYDPAARTRDLAHYNSVHILASGGGKTILTNH